MGTIFIKCPNTGRDVPTGMGMDKGSFESGNLTNNSVGCSACGEMHIWSKEDAFLKED